MKQVTAAHRSHVPQLVQSAEHWGAGINGRLAVRITRTVGTMWCAYAFAMLALYGLPAALNGGFVQWASSNFIQLVLLPVIIVGQNVQASASDARAAADHATLLALAAINQRQLQILEALHGVKP
jgi:hypothetical protein